MLERAAERSTDSANEAVLRQEIRRQIEGHEERQRSYSWLASAIDSVWRGDDATLAQLRQAEAQTRTGGQARARDVAALVKADRDAVAFQDEIAHYGSGFLKTAALFMRGKVGMAGTVALYALDQMKPNDDLATQMIDLGLGGAKGGLLKGAFHVLGSKQVGVAARGVGLGVSSRILDLGLSPQTYMDGTTRGIDLPGGLRRVVTGSLDKGALVTDLIIFGSAHGLLSGADRLASGAVKRSPLLSTMLTGTTFGLSAGATSELLRQQEAGEKLDVSKIAVRALVQGGFDTLAATAGAVQADFGFRARMRERTGWVRQPLGRRLDWIRERLEPYDRQGLKDGGDGQRETAVEIVRILQKAGHTAVFAGGGVRDELLGLKPKDYDIATSATPEQVKKLFQRTILDGEDYGVVKVRMNGVTADVATLRLDGQYGDGRRPDSVELLTEAGEESLRKDASRRDFTFNALFKDPISGKVYDFFGGVEDLKRGVVRAVGDPSARIIEDRLRMLRAVRFATVFGFELEPVLKEAIQRHAGKIHGVKDADNQGIEGFGERSKLARPVSGERIREELFKILASSRPLVGLDLLMETGLMSQILPEVAATNSAAGDQDPVWHPEGNTWVHSRLVVEQLRAAGAPAELVLAGLLHDVGKPRTQVRHPGGRISNHGHDQVGAEMVQEIADRLKLSNEQSDRLVTLVAMHMKMHKGKELRTAKLTELLENKYIRDMVALQHADAMGTGRADRASKSLLDFYTDKLEELTRRVGEAQRLGAKPLLNGDDLIELGHKPGPRFKEMLGEALDLQREGVLNSRDEAKQWARQRFGSAENR